MRLWAVCALAGDVISDSLVPAHRRAPPFPERIDRWENLQAASCPHASRKADTGIDGEPARARPREARTTSV